MCNVGSLTVSFSLLPARRTRAAAAAPRHDSSKHQRLPALGFLPKAQQSVILPFPPPRERGQLTYRKDFFKKNKIQNKNKDTRGLQ